MADEKRCDIIIPVYNKPDLTGSCLDSIARHTHSPYTIILIDNASSEATKKLLRDFKETHSNVVLIENGENVGWVKAVNRGIRQSSAPYVCVMNNDTVVETDDWLARLIGVAEMAGDIGLVNPDFEGKCGCPRAAKPYIEIDFCRGYCIVIKRSVIDAIGGLDEAYGLGYYDDDDFSVRAIRAGFRCVKANNVTVRHLRDSTFSELFADAKRRELHRENRELFYARWGKRLRLVFIITKKTDRKKLADILLGIARRQHVVYLWNSTARLGIEHTNIREKRFWAPVSGLLFPVLTGLNRTKRPGKHYNAIFADDARLARSISRAARGGAAVYDFDAEKDAARIGSIVDAAARV